MDIAAQELNRARGPFACGVADKADQISALWTGRSDAVPRTMRHGERSGHGFTGGQMRWHLRQAMQSPQPRCHRQSSAVPREQIRPLRHEASWVLCRGERSGHNAAKRQPNGMRNGAERRHLERTLASGIAAQNKKGARVMRTPSPEHKLMLFSSVLCNLSCNSFFSSLF